MAEAWRVDLLALADGRRPVVALEFTTTPEAIAAYLGALRAQLPLLLVEPGQLGPDTALRRVWHPEIRIATTDGVLRAHKDATPATDLPAPHPDLALLLSTSGSTGDPKLVRLSRCNIASNASAIAEYLAITPADRAMTTLPLFYSYGFSVLNSYMAAGATLILTERSVIEPAFWEAFRDHGATSLALVPHQFDLLDRSGFAARSLPGLRYITQAGGKLAPDSVRRFDALGKAAGWDLVLMYGQTEAAPRISYVPPAALPQAADTIGQPIPGGRLRIIDATGAEITRPGIQGELVYDGPNVMMGYAGTRADLARGAEVSDLRTGDIAERTADGLYRIVGRMKRFVKIFGLRLSLDQIEALLHDRGIATQAVAVDDRLVLLHAEAGDGPAARKTVADAYDLPPAELHVGHLAELPLLASGKPDHKALRALAVEVLRIETARPKPAGQSLAEVLRLATRSAAVGPQDSFTSLGGDSLSYLQVQMALEERFGQAPAGWENMDLAALEALEQTAAGQPGPGQRGWMRLPVDVMLRLLAVTLIITQHASSYPVHGGAWMLITLMGFTAARFQLRQIGEGETLRFGFRMLYPIVPLYFLLLIGYGFLLGRVPAGSILFLGNYHVWVDRSPLMIYWFVSLYMQIVLLLMLVSAVPPARRLLARFPWGAAAGLAGALLMLEAALVLPGGYVGHHVVAWPWPHYATQGLLECLPLFLAGWMLQHMQGGAQRLATLILAAVSVALFAHLEVKPLAVILLAATMAFLALDPPIRVPVRIGRLLQNLAAVTLFVYLLHVYVIFALAKLHLPEAALVAVSIAGSFAGAVLAKKAFDIVDRFVLGLFRQGDLGWPQALTGR
ncbi:MAG: AMP-binding protein [Mangrovicoccus sp.]|nr:AMP-binding protein [Mangrovicoccus sp.]